MLWTDREMISAYYASYRWSDVWLLSDCMFFRKNAMGQLHQLSRKASDEDIMAANSATLKLDNSKNGWKGVCVNQEANGEELCCPVRVIGR
mmetsp:Transcript_12364/g.26849  ORF Transcript_12364/g.26849 Transcript_12364/m.26849 type:complete len:91 (+) Transcript_12364:1154-1426(+)